MVNMDKNNAIKIDYYGDLDSTIKYLKECNEKNENVYVDFGSDNGVIRLYSLDIDEDNVYLRIYGVGKGQVDLYNKKISKAKEENNLELVKELEESLKKSSQEYFNILKKDAELIPFVGSSLSEVIEALNEYKKLGKNVYVNYKSTEDDEEIKIYSIDLDVDNIFLTMMGITKEQYDENKERFKLARSDEELQMVMTDFYQLIKENINK